jgi:phage-related protein
MSEVMGEGILVIRTDESGVDVDGAGKRAGAGYSKGFGASLKGLAGVIGATLAAGKVLDFAKESVAEAREAQKVGAATEQIIKATGSAAKVTAGQIGDLASSLSAKTGIDDEQIQAGENLLLTFKNVKREGEGLNDIFGRATAAGLDLAASGFGSVEGNAKQLGKALNDPIKGIAALSKSGVTFTEGQKAQIKAMTEAGDLLGAQKVILGEVEAQVGGVAEATATAGEKSAVAWGNIKESIGTLLLPALDAVATFFAGTIAPAIQELIANADKLGPVFSAIGSVISSVFGPAIESVVTIAGQLAPVFAEIADVVSTALSSIDFSTLLVGVQGLLAVMFPAIPIFLALRTEIASLAVYLQANLLPIFQQIVAVVVGSVVPAVVSLGAFITGTVVPAIAQIVTQVATRLKPVFDTLFQVIQTQILPTFQAMVEQIRTQLVPALEPIIQKIIVVVGFLARLAATILSVVLPPLIRWQAFLFSKIIPVLVSVVTFIAKVINALLNLGAGIGSAIGRFAQFYASLVNGVVRAVGQVVSALSGLPGKVLGFVGNMVSAGKGLIGGLLEGMRSAASGVGGIVSSVASAVANAVRSAINSVIDAFNGAIPNSIGIPGAPDIDLPDNPIPHLQSGTRNFQGGYATVGEVGPERVYLPAGARVLTAAQTRQQQTGGGLDEATLTRALVAAVTALRPIVVNSPTPDPEATAMMLMNRLVTS